MKKLILLAQLAGIFCARAATYIPITENMTRSNMNLFRAILRNNVNEMHQCFADGANKDEPGENNKTPLLFAADYDSLEALLMLLNIRANPTAVDSDGKTIFHHAAENSSLEVMSYLMYAKDLWVSHGINLQNFAVRRDNSGRNIFHCAASCEFPDMLDFLINNGKDLLQMPDRAFTALVNAKDYAGRTLLMYAAEKGWIDEMKALIRFEARADEVDNDGNNLMHWAVKGKNSGAVKWMLGEDAKDTLRSRHIYENEFADLINMENSSQKRPLYCSIFEHIFDISRQLIDNDAYVEIDSKEAEMLLCQAAQSGDVYAVNWLLSEAESRAKDFAGFVNSTDEGGWTAFHYAVKNGRKEISHLLIKSGAQIRIRQNLGRFSLLWAALGGDLETMLWIFGKAEDLTYSEFLRLLNSMDDDGNCLFFCAARSGNVPAASWLLSDEAVNFLQTHLLTGEEFRDCLNTQKMGMTAFYRAVESNSVDMVKFLIEQGCNVNREVLITSEGKIGWELPIHLAARKGYADVIRQIIAVSPNSVCEKNFNGENALHLAIQSGNEEAVRLIVNFKPAAAKKQNKDGKQPIHVAAQIGTPDMVCAIIEQYEDAPYKRDPHKRNALHYAVENESAETVRLLLEVNQNAVNQRDISGKSPMHYFMASLQNAAAKNSFDLKSYIKYREIAGLLIKNGAALHAKDRKKHTPLDALQGKIFQAFIAELEKIEEEYDGEYE